MNYSVHTTNCALEYIPTAEPLSHDNSNDQTMNDYYFKNACESISSYKVLSNQNKKQKYKSISKAQNTKDLDNQSCSEYSNTLTNCQNQMNIAGEQMIEENTQYKYTDIPHLLNNIFEMIQTEEKVGSDDNLDQMSSYSNSDSLDNNIQMHIHDECIDSNGANNQLRVDKDHVESNSYRSNSDFEFISESEYDSKTKPDSSSVNSTSKTPMIQDHNPYKLSSQLCHDSDSLHVDTKYPTTYKKNKFNCENYIEPSDDYNNSLRHSPHYCCAMKTSTGHSYELLSGSNHKDNSRENYVISKSDCKVSQINTNVSECQNSLNLIHNLIIAVSEYIDKKRKNKKKFYLNNVIHYLSKIFEDELIIKNKIYLNENPTSNSSPISRVNNFSNNKLENLLKPNKRIDVGQVDKKQLVKLLNNVAHSMGDQCISPTQTGHHFDFLNSHHIHDTLDDGPLTKEGLKNLNKNTTHSNHSSSSKKTNVKGGFQFRTPDNNYRIEWNGNIQVNLNDPKHSKCNVLNSSALQNKTPLQNICGFCHKIQYAKPLTRDRVTCHNTNGSNLNYVSSNDQSQENNNISPKDINVIKYQAASQLNKCKRCDPSKHILQDNFFPNESYTHNKLKLCHYEVPDYYTNPDFIKIDNNIFQKVYCRENITNPRRSYPIHSYEQFVQDSKPNSDVCLPNKRIPPPKKMNNPKKMKNKNKPKLSKVEDFILPNKKSNSNENTKENNNTNKNRILMEPQANNQDKNMNSYELSITEENNNDFKSHKLLENKRVSSNGYNEFSKEFSKESPKESSKEFSKESLSKEDRLLTNNATKKIKFESVSSEYKSIPNETIDTLGPVFKEIEKTTQDNVYSEANHITNCLVNSENSGNNKIESKVNSSNKISNENTKKKKTILDIIHNENGGIHICTHLDRNNEFLKNYNAILHVTTSELSHGFNELYVWNSAKNFPITSLSSKYNNDSKGDTYRTPSHTVVMNSNNNERDYLCTNNLLHDSKSNILSDQKNCDDSCQKVNCGANHLNQDIHNDNFQLRNNQLISDTNKYYHNENGICNQFKNKIDTCSPKLEKSYQRNSVPKYTSYENENVTNSNMETIKNKRLYSGTKLKSNPSGTTCLCNPTNLDEHKKMISNTCCLNRDHHNSNENGYLIPILCPNIPIFKLRR